MKYPAYPKYKDSGVEWLGEVPEHWEVKRLKHYIQHLNSGASVNSDNMPTEDDFPGILKTSCVYGDVFRPEENKRVVEEEVDRVFCPVVGDSLIISRMNTPELVGSCGYVDQGRTNLYLPDRLWITVFVDKRKAFPKFFWYRIISRDIKEQISSLATGTSGSMKNLMQESFLSIAVAIPPHFEQRTIATFLDAQTSKLDTLIAKKRELVEKLKEKRATLITRTVTRGLPPEAATAAGLDPQPKMKGSGVEWLGEVPEHWEVKRLKNIVDSIQIGPFGGMLTEVVDSQTGIKLYGQENIISGDFGIGFRWIPEGIRYLIHNYEVKPGDILITRKGSLGHSKIFPNNQKIGIIDSDTIRIRVNSSMMLNKYLQNLLNNSSFTEAQVDMNKRGAILSGVNTAVISGLIMCVPPVEEQDVIIKFLDRKTAALDALVAKVETAIERLQEYRAALITAAVTGQIDVREVVQ